MKNPFRQWLLWAALPIPLTDISGWQLLQYKKIPANQVVATAQGLEIQVQKSASPLVWPLAHETRVKGFRCRGQRKGPLAVRPEKQGQRHQDDFTIRFGLVVSGQHRLSRVERWLAPDWVLHLEKLMPSGRGVGRIEFFNVVESTALVGQKRTHPGHKLLKETYQSAILADGRFVLDVTLPQALDVMAIYISTDGDDTGSQFNLQISDLTLQVEP